MASRLALIDLLKTLHPTRDEKGLFAEILKGNVLVNGEKIMKPGTRVPADAKIVVPEPARFVSRGGDKLAGALDAWQIECGGTVWIDAGCSTGGFTDCLLQHGASFVHAVDVGDAQLDWRLREDPRVGVREGTNIMTVGPSDLDPPPDAAAVDLSFRSLRGAARHVLGLTRRGWGIFLVKPQFEYQDPAPDFHGVVKDAATLRLILSDLLSDLAAEGVDAERAIPSPITGRKGNREFLLRLMLRDAGRAVPADPRGLIEDLLLQ
jgi:23S rRNA (cytidine1920-2'-O)/16S rRNA (cytidine1409-2'-O)-methyltransferase